MWIRVIGLVVSLFCAACEAPVETMAGAHQDFLSDTELARFRDLAGHGDADAAFRLGIHFAAQPQHQVEAIDWFRRAAEHDHNMATQHLVVHLNAQGDCDEAQSWLERLDKRVTDGEERLRLGVDDMIAHRQSDYEVCASQL